jgi:Uma2 family endonuclease
MVKTPTKTFTLDEFLKLPETKPASEYINGQIIPVPELLAGWQVTVGDLFGWLRLGGDSFT